MVESEFIDIFKTKGYPDKKIIDLMNEINEYNKKRRNLNITDNII